MVKLAQKYARATQSSNLQSDEHHSDTDSLAAVALSSELGSLLFRVKYANDSSSHKALALAWRAIVADKAAHRQWPQHVSIVTVTETSLAHWLNDVCPVCEGKGAHALANSPILDDEPCHACKGTGRKELLCESRVKDYVLDMLETLEAMTIHAGSVAMRKLARDIDDII